jgi:serine protease Do
MKVLYLVAFLLLVVDLPAATVKDREAAVRADRATLENSQRWIYNDFRRGFAKAKSTDKPLLVVLRCVPCLGCAGLDSAVLLQEGELTPLLDQFVCVRIIDANALDLRMFQFDYDLSFSTLFFNGDGTVYGRYGSWAHQKNPGDKTLAGYKRALEATLTLHGNYPANKAALAGKQGKGMEFKTSMDIPALNAKYKPQLDWEGKVVGSCVHCHQIGEALRQNVRDKNLPLTPELIYAWPSPRSIGLTMAADQIARVESVDEGSVAFRAGLKPGDNVIELAGQPLISIADMSWILHHAPAEGIVSALVKNASGQREVKLSLAGGWREQVDISARVGAWDMRAMAFGGMLLADLPDQTRAERGLAKEQMALLVKTVGQFGKHGVAKKAGFCKDDILVEIDGKTERMSESQLIGYLLQSRTVGERVKTTVLRDSHRLELVLPMQ